MLPIPVLGTLARLVGFAAYFNAVGAMFSQYTLFAPPYPNLIQSAMVCITPFMES
jgi:hypothetical protein